MTGPIKPSDAMGLRRKEIPEEVFQAFNELICENLRGFSATVLQSDVVERIRRQAPHIGAVLFLRGWLDVEDCYREQGWTVTYDKPGYNETYEASFVFTAAKQQ